jgi:DNA-binding Lrp family transcriptional regulator
MNDSCKEGKTMEDEGRILNIISKNSEISQRQLSKSTNISLGQINYIIHSLVKKGLIKMEKISPRKLRYVLTPKGIVRNTKRTHYYIKNAVKHVLTLKGELALIVKKYSPEGYNIYIDNEQDEISEIFKPLLREKEFSKVKFLKKEKATDPKALIIVWHIEKEQKYADQGIKCINLLNGIDSI